MEEYIIKEAFLKLYKNGQRLFKDIEFIDGIDLSNEILNDIEFKDCSLFDAIFNNAQLRNSKFNGCNLKCTDFRNANLTNATFKYFSCESSMFEDAIITNAVFNQGFAYGYEYSHEDFIDMIKDDNRRFNTI